MAERKKVIAVKGKEIKEFPSMTHASYFAGYTNPGGLYRLLKSNNRIRKGWKFSLKENIK